jgi:hypothetical protein
MLAQSLRHFALKQGVLLVTFAEDVCLRGSNILLTAGHLCHARASLTR